MEESISEPISTKHPEKKMHMIGPLKSPIMRCPKDRMIEMMQDELEEQETAVYQIEDASQDDNLW